MDFVMAVGRLINLALCIVQINPDWLQVKFVHEVISINGITIFMKNISPVIL